MSTLTFDKKGFRIDGEDRLLVSGEFHYFRVPAQDWRRRMRLFKEAGGNCLATYVPWLIHEPAEGDIRFGGESWRDLPGFLSLAAEMGLKVLLRPGPYQYSELCWDGLPEWLIRDYPQILAADARGRVFAEAAVSYLHPVFLEKARRYFRAFADTVRPFMDDAGGPVAMLQVDNELGGIHIWRGSLDYNRETAGFGREDGRYPRFLKEKYGDIRALNDAYDAHYAAFEEVFPTEKGCGNNAAAARMVRDYHAFYLGMLAEYACLLASWLREDGLNAPICHNSGGPTMNCLFAETVDRMGKGFLLGSDHYYNLNASWPQNSPTPQYCIRTLMSCETMRALGMPPSVLELPGGSPSDTPPILKEDLLCCYMANVAMGAKGVNFYVYTGGPNVPGTGMTADIYDYNAHVRADGTLNETYEALKAFGTFLRENAWLQRAERVTSAQVGFEWDTLRSAEFDLNEPGNGARAARFLERGVIYTMLCSGYAPEMKLLTGELDPEKPLIVPAPAAMSAKARENILSFVEKGGKALVMPAFPTMDEELRPVDGFLPFGGAAFEKAEHSGPVLELENGLRVYGARPAAFCTQLPEGAVSIAKDARTGRCAGFEVPYGAGKLLWLGVTWEMATFDQAAMLENLMERMGARPCVASENRSVFTSLFEDRDGRRMLFVLNPYSGCQKTRVRVFGGRPAEYSLSLSPMEVKAVSIPK